MVKTARREDRANRYYSPKPATWEPEPGERFALRLTEGQGLGPLLVGHVGRWKVVPWHHGYEDLRLGQTWLVEEICHWSEGRGKPIPALHKRNAEADHWSNVIYVRPLRLIGEGA